MDEEKIKGSFSKVKEDMDFLFKEIQELKRTLRTIENQTLELLNKTNQQRIPTHQHTLKPLINPNLAISIGNEGVPTDRQTNQQTDRHTQKFVLKPKIDQIDRLHKASEILESLDELKKEVRSKFKQLTNQEMLIFTTVYQLEEQSISPDYSIIAEKLKLSESSVRDYIGKIIKKGIPINKEKQSNKRVILSISSDLKKMASLNTIIQLREL